MSFPLTDGGRLALIGENGSGKSTLLRIITGNLEPDTGEIFGLNVGCAYIAQDFSGTDEETPREFLARHVGSMNKKLSSYSTSQALILVRMKLGSNKSGVPISPAGRKRNWKSWQELRVDRRLLLWMNLRTTSTTRQSNGWLGFSESFAVAWCLSLTTNTLSTSSQIQF